jgi:peptide/nickel transport system permease protein
MCFLAVFAPLLEPYPPDKAAPFDTLLSPRAAHPFGTDSSGFDVLSRVIAAARIDLIIAISGTAIAVLLGGAIGTGIGFFGGPVANIVSRAFDLIQSFPVFILALVVVALFGQSAGNIIFAIAFVYTPFFVRIFRSQTLTIKERGFVKSAHVTGVSNFGIMGRHILPNAIAPALGQWSTTVGWAILMAAGLSFVGAGIQPPHAEWGVMIAGGASYVTSGQWWIAFFPGVAISLTVIGFTLLSEGLQDISDPRRR